MFTAETLEMTWKRMKDYEREHFGLRFGDDFGAIAAILRQNEGFMSLGGIMTMLAALEMGGISREMQTASESAKAGLVNDLMKKPSGVHNTLAELFYLGYQLGRQTREVDVLETFATSRGPRP